MIVATYDSIKPTLRVGDVLFFGGRGHLSWGGFVSWGIKTATGSPLSHAAVVISRQGDDRNSVYYGAELVESTSLAGQKAGCIRTPAEWRVETYDGSVWVAPLSDQVRADFNEKAFVDFMLGLQGRPYNYAAVLHMIWEPLAVVPGFHWLMNKDTLAAMYCSEYIAAGFKAVGVLGRESDYAETSPQDLAKRRLYRDLLQIKGPLQAIPLFNTVDIIPPKSQPGAALILPLAA